METTVKGHVVNRAGLLLVGAFLLIVLTSIFWREFRGEEYTLRMLDDGLPFTLGELIYNAGQVIPMMMIVFGLSFFLKQSLFFYLCSLGLISLGFVNLIMIGFYNPYRPDLALYFSFLTVLFFIIYTIDNNATRKRV